MRRNRIAVVIEYILYRLFTYTKIFSKYSL